MAIEELRLVSRLLEMEREEDLKQYQEKILRTPLGERRIKGLTWYPVTVKGAEIGTGEKYYVSIERTTHLDEPHAFQVGGMVSLFNHSHKSKPDETASGVISMVWKNAMRIALNEDEIPEWLEYGQVGVDVLFDANSYKEMAAAMEKVVSAKEGRLAEMRRVLLGQQPAAFDPALASDFVEVPSLNGSQNHAIRNILTAKDVAIIHGPPGTGKTTTLVQAVCQTLQREKQVLVTAPSNTAVDLLTERLAAQGVKVLRIGNPARVSEELMHHSVEAQMAMHPDYRHLKKLRRDADEYRRLAHKYKRKFGKDEREQRRLLMAESHNMLTEATILEKYIVDSLLNEAQAITATLVGSVNKFIRYRTFSTVFIDEAAQALEPACWIAIAKSDRVVFAGDHCQLPPTVKSYEAGKQGLSETLFEKCIRRQQADVMLQVQYRMNEAIMGFSNGQFYHGQLLAAPHVQHHLLTTDLADPLLAHPIEFVDTAGCGFEEKVNEETQSKLNPSEAQALIKHLGRLFNHIYYTHKHLLNDTFSIGIISPYMAQVELLKELVQNDPEVSPFAEFVQVNSVDGFQGQEREAIYISLVRSNDKGTIGFLADTRRMNVAMTRAKKKLVIFGDSATLSSHAFYLSFLEYIEQKGQYRTAWELQ